MSEKKIEKRLYSFEIRTDNNETHGDFVEGTPIVFNSVYNNGYFDEIIAPGALDKTDLRDVKFLVNHNTDMIPLARSRRNNENSTMQMEVKEDGMHIRVDLDTKNNSEAKNLYSAIKRGDISGMSFMFTVDGESWEGLETDHPKRTITSIEKVFEVSAVSFPAYEDTDIHARCAEVLEEQRAALDKARVEEQKKAEEERNALKQAEARAVKARLYTTIYS